MKEDQIKQTVFHFLYQHLRTDNLGEDESIFASGLVNSLFAMQLVLFVEKEFGIQVENEDLELHHFQSVNAISQLVARKKRENGATP
jgi:methoxymalonate biosynthesis acyl carrier protein